MTEIQMAPSLQLHQKHLLSEKNFVIVEKGVMITSASKGQLSEILVPYEEITSTITSYHKSHFWLLVAAVAMMVATILWITAIDWPASVWWKLIGLFTAPLLLLLYFLSKQKFWLISLTSGTHIMIWKQIPDPVEVQTFIDQLYLARNQHLMKWYGTFRELIKYEAQFEQIKFLYALGVIDAATFDQMDDALMSLYEKKSKAIGFRTKRDKLEEE